MNAVAATTRPILRAPHQSPRGWSLHPARTHLVTEHAADSAEVVCWQLRPDGAVAAELPSWTVAGHSPNWRILGWASDRHLVLWRRSRRSQLWVLDIAGAGSPSSDALTWGRAEVLGRPIQCRVNPAGHLEVLVAVSGASRPELCLYQAQSDSYLRVPSTRDAQGVAAWDAERAVFAAALGGAGPGVQLFRYGPAGCVELDVDWPEGTRVTRAAGCVDGLLALTGCDAEGRTIPGVLDLATGSVRWFGEQVGSAAAELAASGTRLLTSAWVDQRFTYQVLDLAGRRIGELDPGPGLATDVRLARDEEHLIGWHQSPAVPPGLTRWALSDPRPHRLGPWPSSALQPRVRWRHRWVTDTSGREIPEWIFEPTGARQAGTVLFLHGGPGGQLRQEYDRMIDALVSAGWTVVGPNYPGSAGYGPQHRQWGRADWGGVDAETLRRRLGELHAAAQGRPVCVYGQSYGAYLALLVTAARVDLVAATAVWAPVTDLAELSAGMTGVRRSWLDDELGDLRLDAGRLWERSPVSHAPALARTRLLIGHGKQDDRCPVDHSRRLVELVQQHQQGRAGVSYVEDAGGHAPLNAAAWSRAVTEHFGAAGQAAAEVFRCA